LKFMRLAYAAAACVFISASASAQAPELEFSVRAGLWSKARDLQDNDGRAAVASWVRMTAGEGPLSAFVEGWVGDDTGEADPKGELRRAYVTWSGAEATLRIGRQIEVWGESDFYGPLDVMAPFDYTQLTITDDDARQGRLGARLTASVKDLDVRVLWLPEFRATDYPIPVQFRSALSAETGDRWRPGSLALRIGHRGGVIDWSASLVAMPDTTLSVERSGPGGSFTRQYPRNIILATDASTNADAWLLRAEAAYTDVDATRADVLKRSDELRLILSAERQIVSDTTAAVYYLLRHLPQAQTSLPTNMAEAQIASALRAVWFQNDRTQHGLGARAAWSGLNGAATLELKQLLFLPEREGTTRAMLAYALSDSVKIHTGFNIFYGNSRAYFGALEEASSFFAELRYGF